MPDYNHYQSLGFAVALTHSIVAFNAWLGRLEGRRPAPLTYPVTPPGTPQPWYAEEYRYSFAPYDMDYDDRDAYSRNSF
jgi:hypothetical protein